MLPSILPLLIAFSLAQADGVSVGQLPTGLSLAAPSGEMLLLDDHLEVGPLVIVFIGVECPLVRQYLPKLNELSDHFVSQGVSFLGVDSNHHDTLQELDQFSHDLKIGFPVAQDKDCVLADILGAERTPEAFLIDAHRLIRYSGRIDDQFGIQTRRKRPGTEELATAIRAVLAGEKVAVPRTQPIGCLIGRIRNDSPDHPFTWSEHIAKVVWNRCAGCHQPGDIGPFRSRPTRMPVNWAPMIVEAIENERMPPWHADAPAGKFETTRDFYRWKRNAFEVGATRHTARQS